MNAPQKLPTLIAKAYHYWRATGTTALIQRVLEYQQVEAMRKSTLAAKPPSNELAAILHNRFRGLTPISLFAAEADAPRITVITDSISKGSLFGGVGTSLVLGAIAAERIGARLRIVTRTEPPDTAALAAVLTANRVKFAGKTEFLFIPPDSADQMPVHNLDRFITTSWWTTEAARYIPRQQLFYLLQEDERAFYPAGDDYLRCSNILHDESISLLVNSRLLFDHLAQDMTNINLRGSYFEPAFPSHLFYPEPRAEAVKRTLFFYARPNNPRNLFYVGCEVIQEALSSGILPKDEWRLLLCGKDIPAISFSPSIDVEVKENLRWDEYASFVRRADVGLSLMLTPHPSYPPLDLAASGAVVVTNSFSVKQDLDFYSRNILVADPSLPALVETLKKAVSLAADRQTRDRNHRDHNIQSNWTISLASVVDRIAGTFA